MKRISFLLSALCLFSCSKDLMDQIDDLSSEELVQISVTADIDGTKTSLDALKTSWVKGDRIAVLDGTKTVRVLTADSDGPTATFSGEISASATSICGFYPYYDDATTHSNNSKVLVSTFIPADQAVADGSLLPLQALYTTKSGGKFKLSFKPVSCVVKFTIKPEDDGKYSKIALSGNSTEGKLAGTFAVNFDTGNVAGYSDATTTKYVAYAPTFGSIKAGTYYLGMGTLSNKTARAFTAGPGFHLTLTADNGLETELRSTKSVSINKGSIINIGTLNPTYPEMAKNVTGTVKYDDGTPAVGVMVSDGFRVVLTDKDGKYRIGVTSDTWYIYISLPSDAKVTLNSDNCPDFYQRYSSTQDTYDFTLYRQEVESKFKVIAIADLHGRNQNNETTWLSCVQNETISGIKKVYEQNKDVPCYAITLGDITHNWWTVNSNNNGTFERMHELLSTQYMPCPTFNVLGNHDFTWYDPTHPLVPDATSSTRDLKWQRKYEGVFGPVNYSFTRGKVHFVCMKNTLPTEEGGTEQIDGYSDAQLVWLKKDLANVGKDHKVIMCVHVPLTSSGVGDHNRDNVTSLLKHFDSEGFSGHGHYTRYRTVPGTDIPSHMITSPCAGVWGTDNIASDGTPKSVRVFTFTDNRITNDVMYGLVEGMNGKDYQIRIYQGGLKYGGYYAWFQTMEPSNRLIINVFNAKPSWKVEVFENGVNQGQAQLMDDSKRKVFDSVSPGETYTIPAGMCQDWWALGYIKGCRGKAVNSDSYYSSLVGHLYCYDVKTPGASIKVVATDPYGNVYTCTDVITDGLTYPEYLNQK